MWVHNWYWEICNICHSIQLKTYYLHIASLYCSDDWAWLYITDKNNSSCQHSSLSWKLRAIWRICVSSNSRLHHLLRLPVQSNPQYFGIPGSPQLRICKENIQVNSMTMIWWTMGHSFSYKIYTLITYANYSVKQTISLRFTAEIVQNRKQWANWCTNFRKYAVMQLAVHESFPNPTCCFPDVKPKWTLGRKKPTEFPLMFHRFRPPDWVH